MLIVIWLCRKSILSQTASQIHLKSWQEKMSHNSLKYEYEDMTEHQRKLVDIAAEPSAGSFPSDLNQEDFRKWWMEQVEKHKDEFSL